MRGLAACVMGLMLIAGNASAQDCGPFFWFCQRPAGVQVQPSPPNEPRPNPRAWDATVEQQSSGTYGRGGGEPFTFFGQRSATGIDPRYMRRAVSYPSAEPPGTIIVDLQNHFLYFIEGGGRAIRYGIGVGRQGFTLVRRRDSPQQAGMAGLVPAQGNDRAQARAHEPGEHAAERTWRARRSGQSARGSRLVSLAGQQGHALPDPWHQRAGYDRQERVVRLHSHAEPGRHRSLPAHAARRQGRRACVGCSGCGHAAAVPSTTGTRSRGDRPLR